MANFNINANNANGPDLFFISPDGLVKKELAGANDGDLYYDGVALIDDNDARLSDERVPTDLSVATGKIIDGNVTLAKLANIPTDTFLGRDTAGTGVPETISPSAARTILDVYTTSEVDSLIDATLKPPEAYDPAGSGNFPTTYDGAAITRGDTWRIVTADTLGTGTVVNPEDLLIALADTPGQTDSNFMVAESNRDQATETVKGVAQIATQAITDAGTNDTDFITALKLATSPIGTSSHAQSHVLATTAGLGADHTTSGLTAGQVLRASGAAAAAFAQLGHGDLGGVGADDHHSQSHVLATNLALGADHTISGASAGHVLRASGAAAAAFAQLSHSDLGGVGSDDHHAQSHVLATNVGLGADHTISGASAGQVLRASGASAAAFAALGHSDLSGVGSDDHHAQSHILAGTGGLGADHTVSGLTAGQVLRASGAAAAAFAQLSHSDLGSVGADDHHSQSHVLAGTAGLGADHTVTGLTAGQVYRNRINGRTGPTGHRSNDSGIWRVGCGRPSDPRWRACRRYRRCSGLCRRQRRRRNKGSCSRSCSWRCSS
jgi:ribosomal protein L27